MAVPPKTTKTKSSTSSKSVVTKLTNPPEKKTKLATTQVTKLSTATIKPVEAKSLSTDVRRKEMVERIVAHSGMKPNVIKKVLDSVLKELGDALSNGETLNLQPLGKVSVNRQKTIPNGEVIICKLRRKPQIPKTTPGLPSKPTFGSIK